MFRIPDSSPPQSPSAAAQATTPTDELHSPTNTIIPESPLSPSSEPVTPGNERMSQTENMFGSPYEVTLEPGALEPYQREMAAAYNELLSSSPSATTTRASKFTPGKRIHGIDARDTLRGLSRSLTPQRRSEDTDLSYKELEPEVGTMVANLDELDKESQVLQEKNIEATGLFDIGRDEPFEDCILPDEGSGYEDEDQSEGIEDDELEGGDGDSSDARSRYAEEDAANSKSVFPSIQEDEDNKDIYIAEEGKNYSYIEINSVQDKDEEVDEDEVGKEHHDAGLNDDYDDVRDVVKSPGSHVPYHCPEDLASIISHERNPTAEEVHRLEERHHELEEALMADSIDIKHEQNDSSNGEHLKESGLSIEDLKEHAAAVGIAPGVVVVDLEKLDKLLSTGETDNGASIFMPDHAPTPVFLSSSSSSLNKDSILSQAGSSPQQPTDIRLPSFGAKRDSTPTPANLKPPAVIQTPGGKHIKFADGSTVFETPFTKTLNFFKPHRGKENLPNKPSPSKARRNASLPEEIAELAREAHVGEFNEMEENMEKVDEDLRMYRFEDHAPIDPVLKSEVTADIDMASRSPIAHAEENMVWPAYSTEQLMAQGSSDTETRTYKLEIPGHYGESFLMKVETNVPWTQIAESIRQRGEELDASVEDIDKAVRNFLRNPERFVITTQANEPSSPTVVGDDRGEDKEIGLDVAQKDLPTHLGDPTFVKIIFMLPQSLFWAAVKAVGNVFQYGAR